MPWIVKTAADLLPGDIIICRKKLHWWQLIKRFLRWRIKSFSIRTLGPSCIFPDADHAKIAHGEINSLPTGFHWTAPASTFFHLEEYNVDPSYALVFRRKHLSEDSREILYAFCLKHAGMVYNAGQLLDMEMGFKRFFSFGCNHYVCAVGIRYADEAANGSLERAVRDVVVNKIPFDKTPPCLWANLPEVFECVNVPGPLTKTRGELMEDCPCE